MMANERRPAGAASGLIAASKISESRNADIHHDDFCERSLHPYANPSGSECQCAVREVAWVAREALAIHTEHVPHDSPRGLAYFARKHALLAYIEATR